MAGVLTLPVLWWAWQRDAAQLIERWRVWAAVALLVGTPFGLPMFGVLQFAPASHATVFPFTAMRVMGMVLGAVVLGDRLSRRKPAGVGVVLVGLVLVSGVDAARAFVDFAVGRRRANLQALGPASQNRKLTTLAPDANLLPAAPVHRRWRRLSR